MKSFFLAILVALIAVPGAALAQQAGGDLLVNARVRPPSVNGPSDYSIVYSLGGMTVRRTLHFPRLYTKDSTQEAYTPFTPYTAQLVLDPSGGIKSMKVYQAGFYESSNFISITFKSGGQVDQASIGNGLKLSLNPRVDLSLSIPAPGTRPLTDPKPVPAATTADDAVNGAVAGAQAAGLALGGPQTPRTQP